MDLILHQLGELVLGSVPTMVLFLMLIVAYDVLVQRPLKATLAERRARTIGAIEQAREALSAAEAETTVYEDKLRNAKAEIFAGRERLLKQWSEEREATLNDVRRSAHERIQVARREIDQSAGAARAQVESTSGALSTQILRAVLPAGIPVPEVRS